MEKDKPKTALNAFLFPKHWKQWKSPGLRKVQILVQQA